jgi:hypothetical protein
MEEAPRVRDASAEGKAIEFCVAKSMTRTFLPARENTLCLLCSGDAASLRGIAAPSLALGQNAMLVASKIRMVIPNRPSARQDDDAWITLDWVTSDWITLARSPAYVLELAKN